MRATTIALRAVLLLVLVPASFEAAVVRVPDDEPTIQEGVLAASEGDTVLVAADTYTGPMNRDIDFGGKNIVLLSEEGAASTIINCEAAGRGLTFTGGENSMSVVEGFTIMNGSTHDGGAVYCENSSPTFRDCVFEGNRTDGVGGAMSCYASSSTIKDCAFIGNSSELALDGAGGGIYCADGSALTVSGSTFTGNGSDMGGAFACTGGSSVAIATSLIAGNAADSGGAFACRAGSEVTAGRCTMSGNIGVGASGVYTDGASSVILDASIIQATATLTCCDVYQNEYGDWIGCIAGQSGIDGNMSADPLFCWWMNPKERYSLWNDSPCAAANNPECGTIGAFDVGCYVTSVEPASWGQLKALYRAE